MDIDDLDLDVDPTKAFLTHKLEHVKNLKKETQSTVDDLKRMIAEFQDEQLNGTQNALKIEDHWKRVCEEKCVLGMRITNTSETTIKDVNIVLHWKPVTSPIYKIRIFANDDDDKITPAFEVKKIAHLVIAIDKPIFTNHSHYEAKTVLTYKTGNIDCQEILPTITLSVKDFHAEAEVSNVNVTLGNTEAFLAKMTCLCERTLLARLPDKVNRDLEHYLIIDCMLREVDFGGLKYFVSNGISSVVDGSILKYSKNDCLTIFYRDKDHLYHILHHLLSNVPRLNILPLRYKTELLKAQKEAPVFFSQMYATQPVKNNEEVLQFSEFLRKQINKLIDFHADVVENKDYAEDHDVTRKFKRLRDDLDELEVKSDALYDQLCE